MASSEKSAFAANIDTAVTPFLSILRDAGRERERLALELGTEVAKELNPFSLVTLAIAAGFFIGHGPFKWRQEADAGRGSGGGGTPHRLSRGFFGREGGVESGPGF